MAGGWAGDPSAWTAAHETHLINGLLDEAQANAARYVATIRAAANWPSWTHPPPAVGNANNPRGFTLPSNTGPLADGRDSLVFDDSNLPDAPNW